MTSTLNFMYSESKQVQLISGDCDGYTVNGKKKRTPFLFPILTLKVIIRYY